MAVVEADQNTVEGLRLQREGDRIERLWARGRWTQFAVYRVRANALHLNAHNRRFRAEREAIERRLGRALDPDAFEDQSALIALVLDKEPRLNERGEVVGKRNPDTDALREDWLRREQESPFWIQSDGLIVNGNRRWAMLRRLQSEEAFERFEYVDVIVLAEIDERELFRLEASEQLTEGLKVRYGDVNLLLTLREAAELEQVDWHSPSDVERVAEAIKHLVRNDKRRAVIQLKAVFFMDEYLKAIGAEGEFHRLERRVERFRDVANNMMRARSLDRSRESKMLTLSFAAVRADNPHGDVRELRKMLEDQPELFDELYESVVQSLDTIGGILPEPDPAATEPDWTVDEGDQERDEDEDEDVEGVPDAGTYHAVRDLIRLHGAAAAAARKAPGEPIRVAAAHLAKTSPGTVADALAADSDGSVRAAVETIVAWARATEVALNPPPR
jgi:hypothetical protein